MQRLRLKFSRGEELKFLSHLDLMRLWERALRRAGIPLAYSEGFTPHPQIALAAPLLVGVTSEAELMDISLSRWISPQSFTAKIEKHLPRGITLIEVWPVGVNVPSLQSQVKFVDYKVEVVTEKAPGDVEAELASFLSKKELPWHHHRDTGDRYYDLRALVDSLSLIDCRNAVCVLDMRLRCDEKGAGRPEQVTKALGFIKRPKSIHRTNIVLD
ncbi:MAG TPA: TIGR03936 family radical SAM-associated protein [Dehalococcoidia bacterium]|jgi:radical SAM-linked protein